MLATIQSNNDDDDNNRHIELIETTLENYVCLPNSVCVCVGGGGWMEKETRKSVNKERLR